MALVLLVAVSCSRGPSPAVGGTDEKASPTGVLLVSAASSLTDVFEEISSRFRTENPDLDVRLSFAGTPALVAQLENGAPIDVIATADERSMSRLSSDGLVETPKVFARNRLAIAVNAGNPLGIDELDDLARRDITLVVCDPAVPCGRLASQLVQETELRLSPASREPNARATLTKVALGEADAALVYLTDALAVEGVTAVTIPEGERIRTTYMAAVTREAANVRSARAFVEFLGSRTARAVLSEAGFELP